MRYAICDYLPFYRSTVLSVYQSTVLPVLLCHPEPASQGEGTRGIWLCVVIRSLLLPAVIKMKAGFGRDDSRSVQYGEFLGDFLITGAHLRA